VKRLPSVQKLIEQFTKYNWPILEKLKNEDKVIKGIGLSWLTAP
jgi:hypothetical protein